MTLLSQNAISLGPQEAFTGYCWGKMREIDHLVEAGVEGRLLKLVFKERNWMAQDRDWFQALKNAGFICYKQFSCIFTRFTNKNLI